MIIRDEKTIRTEMVRVRPLQPMGQRVRRARVVWTNRAQLQLPHLPFRAHTSISATQVQACTRPSPCHFASAQPRCQRRKDALVQLGPADARGVGADDAEERDHERGGEN